MSNLGRASHAVGGAQQHGQQREREATATANLDQRTSAERKDALVDWRPAMASGPRPGGSPSSQVTTSMRAWLRIGQQRSPMLANEVSISRPR